MLDVGEQLELFEVLKLDPALEPEVYLIVSRKKETSFVLAHPEQQIYVFCCLEPVLLAAGLVPLQKLLYFGEVS